MSERKSPQRKAYRKPEVVRVDLVEGEVALASCKASFTSSHTAPNSGRNVCSSSCKSVSPT